MAFAEDLSVFFDADGFGQPASWGAYSATVIIDMPTEDILGGRVNSKEYLATLPATSFPGIARSDTITAGGSTYQVREVRTLDDGALKSLSLTRIS